MSDLMWDGLDEGLPLHLREHFFWCEQQKGRPHFTECQVMIIKSCLARGDERTAQKHIDDWLARKRKTIRISKFVPGAHFYVLGEKFDTVGEAREYAERRGYHVSSDIAYQRTPYGGD